MMTTPWKHLPNSVHIDRVLASMKANPVEWAASYHEFCLDTYEWGAARRAILDATVDCTTLQVMVYDTLDVALSTALNVPAYSTASGTMLALIAYEDSAHLLDSSTEETSLLMALGHPYVILMLPAVMTFQRINELT